MKKYSTTNMSSYEEFIVKILRAGAVKFQREKTFHDLRNGKYRYDFFLVDYVALLEIDGIYHFKPIRGEQELKAQKERDRRKNTYALAHGINLYRIPYWDIDNGSIKTYNDLFKKRYLVDSKWWNDRIKVPKNL